MVTLRENSLMLYVEAFKKSGALESSQFLSMVIIAATKILTCPRKFINIRNFPKF